MAGSRDCSDFQSVPNEVLVLIFRNLNGVDMRNVSCTCQRWNAVVSSDSELSAKRFRRIFKKLLAKVIILGDAGVGKTALLERYRTNTFTPRYLATIGADFHSNTIKVGPTDLTLQLWDTAGQERFQSLGIAFYRGADACVLVFSLNDLRSFENLEMWRDSFLDSASPSKDAFPFVIVGNKSDLGDRQITDEKLKESWCKNLPYFETSARDNLGVDALFSAIGEIVVEEAQISDVDVPFFLPGSPIEPETSLCKC